MKKKLISDDSYHAVWLQFGINKLKQLKAALPGQRAKRTYAIDELSIVGRESSDTVIIEVKATEDEATDEVTVIQVPPQYYFGFAASVEMRCRCRGVVLAKTAAPALVAPTAQGISIEQSGAGGQNFTQTWGFFAGDMLVSSETGTSVISAFTEGLAIQTVNNYLNNFGQSFGFGGIANGVIVGGISSSVANTPIDQHPAYAAAQAAADAQNAQLAATANQRSAVFLTDGTELGSTPNSGVRHSIGEGQDGNVVTQSGVFPYGRLPNLWAGGKTIEYGITKIPAETGDEGYTRQGEFSINVPDDVCFVPEGVPYRQHRNFISAIDVDPPANGGGFNHVRNFYYISAQNTIAATIVGTRTYSFDVDGQQQVTYFRYYKASSTSSTQENLYTGTIPVDMDDFPFAGLEIENVFETVEALNTLVSASVAAFALKWKTDQILGIARENKRRLKCSQAQHELLRNGFLPPEFEYFIKTFAAKSVKVRRKYPMQVVTRSQQLISDITDANDARTRIWSASVTVKYDVVDVQGNVTPKQETFTGAMQQVITEHKSTDINQTSTTSTEQYTYTNLPMLVNNITGKAFPLPSPLPTLPRLASLKLKTTGAIWHDDKTYPLLVIANGTFNHNIAWLENDTYGTATYQATVGNVNVGALVPPVQKTSDNLIFTHPQFLYDYIKASPPIEFETVAGKKVAVTPSTDWLSSRLSDKEIIRIVPLSYINHTGENHGMFPLSTTNEEGNNSINELRIYGYAEFRYSAATSIFTFVAWVEFTEDGKQTIKADDEITLNDELNPTVITVTNNGQTNTYNLMPKSFAYEEEWGITNCVCVASKVLWSDLKTDYKNQKTRLSDKAPNPAHTAEEKLYKAVAEAIA